MTDPDCKRRGCDSTGRYRAPCIHEGMTLAEFAACIGITLPHTNTDEQDDECAD